MTIPGLALFYGGLVRTKNVLSILMQCFVITTLVSLFWLILAASLVPVSAMLLYRYIVRRWSLKEN